MTNLTPPAAAVLPDASCQNCGFRGGGRYYQECGQLYATHRITLPHLLHEVFHLFTHIEKGFLYTLKQLLLYPGDMQRRYLAGQRVGLQAPISAFFLACTITALGQFAIKSLVLRWYGIQDDADDYFRHYFALAQMALLPLYALVTWLFFRREKYNYAEIAVVVLYSLSLLIYTTLALNALRLLWPHFNTRYVELPLVIAYNLLTYLRLFPDAPRVGLVAKSLFINGTCFLLSMGVEALMAGRLH